MRAGALRCFAIHVQKQGKKQRGGAGVAVFVFVETSLPLCFASAYVKS